MRIIISDVDMGETKTFKVSREYLARLVSLLENGDPLINTRSPELNALLQKGRLTNKVTVTRECLMQIERELSEAAE